MLLKDLQWTDKNPVLSHAFIIMSGGWSINVWCTTALEDQLFLVEKVNKDGRIIKRWNRIDAVTAQCVLFELTREGK